jgi:hypothetical protein
MPNQMKDGIGRPGTDLIPHPASHRRSAYRRKIFRELVHMAAEQGAAIKMGISTAQALQECLDRAVALMRFAADQVDALYSNFPDGTPLSELSPQDDPLYEVTSNPQGPDIVKLHRYILWEREARLEVEKLAAMMTQLGVAERVVRVEEAKAALMVAAVREAALDAGLDHETVRNLGAALRKRIEGGLDHQRAPGEFAGPASDPKLQYRGPSRGTVAEGQKIADTMQRAEIIDEPRDLPTDSS